MLDVRMGSGRKREGKNKEPARSLLRQISLLDDINVHKKKKNEKKLGGKILQNLYYTYRVTLLLLKVSYLFFYNYIRRKIRLNIMHW